MRQDVGCCDLVCHTNTLNPYLNCKAIGFGLWSWEFWVPCVFVHGYISTSNWMLEILIIWFCKGRTVPNAVLLICSSYRIFCPNFLNRASVLCKWMLKWCCIVCQQQNELIIHHWYSRCVIAGSTNIISCPVLMPNTFTHM